MTNSPSKSNSQEAENGLAPDSRDEYSADLQRLRDIAVEQLCGLASHSHRSDGSATEVTHSSTNSNQVVVDRPRPTGHNSQQAKRHTEDVMPPIHVTKKDTRAATASSATAITARSPSRKSESGISASDGEESNSSSSQSDGDDYEDDPSGDTKMKQKPLIIWEKWRDPFGEKNDDDLDLDIDSEEFDDNTYNEIESEEVVAAKVLLTPMGLIPYNDNTASSKIFNFSISELLNIKFLER